MPQCGGEGCKKPGEVKGYCPKHYDRLRNNGDPEVAQRSWTSQAGLKCPGPECGREAEKRGYCNAHYRQWRAGEELRPLRKVRGQATKGMTTAERVAYYTGPVANDKGCWFWTGPLSSTANSRGQRYGIVHDTDKGKYRQAHRVAYELEHGVSLTSSWEHIHHTCEEPQCIRGSHLQHVRDRENTAEMLQRNFYIDRIERLETALAEYAPEHELLAV